MIRLFVSSVVSSRTDGSNSSRARAICARCNRGCAVVPLSPVGVLVLEALSHTDLHSDIHVVGRGAGQVHPTMDRWVTIRHLPDREVRWLYVGDGHPRDHPEYVRLQHL